MNNVNEANVKQCCAAFYGSDLARLLLGESFHPGGVALTDRLAQFTQLNRDSQVLDVAAGRGTSAFHLAQTVGCEIVGVDLSESNVKLATEESVKRSVADRVTFRIGDTEELPFEADTFDAVLCECAYCTFTDKAKAAAEFSRVLKPGGQLGLSDLTRTGGPIPELDGILPWIACVGDAQPVETYLTALRSADFEILRVEDQSQSLIDLVRQIQGRLLGAEIATALKKFNAPEINFSDAKHFIHAALAAVDTRKLGYAIIIATKRYREL